MRRVADTEASKSELESDLANITRDIEKLKKWVAVFSPELHEEGADAAPEIAMARPKRKRDTKRRQSIAPPPARVTIPTAPPRPEAAEAAPNAKTPAADAYAKKDKEIKEVAIADKSSAASAPRPPHAGEAAAEPSQDMPRQEDAPGDTEGKGRTSDTAANAPLAEQTAGGQVAKSAEEPGNAPTISDVPDAPVEAERAEAAKQQHASKPETKTTPVETATEESAPVAEKAGAKEAASEEPARRQAVEADVAEMAEPAAKEPAAEAEVAEMAEPAAEADTGKAPKTASLDDADRPAAKRQSTAAAAKSAPKKPPGKKATKKAGGKKAAPKKSKKVATKKTSPKKKADTKETRPNTLEDELAETLTPEEIDSFQIEKVDMEKLTYKVCDLLAQCESDGMFQADLYKKLKLSARNGARLSLKLERMGTVTRVKLLEKERWTYKLILKKTPVSTTSLEGAPCLTCQFEQRCSVDGEISPMSCPYIEEWVIADLKRIRAQ